MDQKQQEKYEALVSEPSLYLAALKFDELRLTVDAYRWSFLSLSDLISRWADSDDDLARMPADETAQTLQGWDDKIFGVFASPDSGNQMPLNVLDQKFLARVVTAALPGCRRIASDWRGQEYARPRPASDPSVYTHRREGAGRTFKAEVR